MLKDDKVCNHKGNLIPEIVEVVMKDYKRNYRGDNLSVVLVC